MIEVGFDSNKKSGWIRFLLTGNKCFTTNWKKVCAVVRNSDLNLLAINTNPVFLN